jgi:hypothetical protein
VPAPDRGRGDEETDSAWAGRRRTSVARTARSAQNIRGRSVGAAPPAGGAAPGSRRPCPQRIGPAEPSSRPADTPSGRSVTTPPNRSCPTDAWANLQARTADRVSGTHTSTSRRWSQRRLPASRCDGASATVDTTAVTSKAARTRKRRRAGTYPFIPFRAEPEDCHRAAVWRAVLRRRMYMSSQYA